MNDLDRMHKSSRLISAGSARIYNACIQPEKLACWIAPRGAEAEIEKFDAREGGDFKIILTFGDNIGKSSSQSDVVLGRFLTLVPDQKIVQAIDFEAARPEFSGTMTMSWTFKSAGDKTLVSVVAENVPMGISKIDHEMGMASTLENLARFLESVC